MNVMAGQKPDSSDSGEESGEKQSKDFKEGDGFAHAEPVMANVV